MLDSLCTESDLGQQGQALGSAVLFPNPQGSLRAPFPFTASQVRQKGPCGHSPPPLLPARQLTGEALDPFALLMPGTETSCWTDTAQQIPRWDICLLRCHWCAPVPGPSHTPGHMVHWYAACFDGNRKLRRSGCFEKPTSPSRMPTLVAWHSSQAKRGAHAGLTSPHCFGRDSPLGCSSESGRH